MVEPAFVKRAALVLGVITGTVLVSLILAYSGVGLAAQLWPWRLAPLIFLAGLVAGMAALSAPNVLRSARPGQEHLAIGLLLMGGEIAAGRGRWTACPLDLPLLAFLVIVPTVMLFAAMPITLNGLGVRELGFVGLLGAQGIPEDRATLFALLAFVGTLGFAVAGGMVFLLGDRPRTGGET